MEESLPINRFFDEYNPRKKVPRRTYARLDDFEPIYGNISESDLLVFDVVDADWHGFDDNGPFPLKTIGFEKEMANFWKGRFSGDVISPKNFEEIPVYHIEVASDLFSEVVSKPIDEETWYLMELSNTEIGIPVKVYGGLFSEPLDAFLIDVSEDNVTVPQLALSAAFDMDFWPDESSQKLITTLSNTCELSAVVCFDVGQGLASALICQCGFPIYYFDTGRGSRRNAPTAPAFVDFCACDDPTIILSHWDTDHWAGSIKNAAMLSQKWIVPRQKISVTHTLFADSILSHGGSIHVIRNNTNALQWSYGAQHFELQRGTGTGRNQSGLILVVEDQFHSRSWVLNGDTSYNYVPHNIRSDIAAMMVPHHGANLGPSSIPFSPSVGSKYRRLLYSFGPNNSHGPNTPPVRHPVSSAVSAHHSSGWLHGAWSLLTPANCLAAGDVLATATHSSTHLGGIAAGWKTPPALNGHLNICSHVMPITQT